MPLIGNQERGLYGFSSPGMSRILVTDYVIDLTALKGILIDILMSVSSKS